MKRYPQSGIDMKALYPGAIIVIQGRQLKIIEYGDVATRKRFEVDRQRTFAMIKPDAYTNIGKIIDLSQRLQDLKAEDESLQHY